MVRRNGREREGGRVKDEGEENGKREGKRKKKEEWRKKKVRRIATGKERERRRRNGERGR